MLARSGSHRSDHCRRVLTLVCVPIAPGAFDRGAAEPVEEPVSYYSVPSCSVAWFFVCDSVCVSVDWSFCLLAVCLSCRLQRDMASAVPDLLCVLCACCLRGRASACALSTHCVFDLPTVLRVAAQGEGC